MKLLNKFFNHSLRSKRTGSTIHGFTLIELLVVVSLIGILATLVLANLTSGRSRGRDAQRKSDLKQISTALRLYYNDHGEYPAENELPWGSEWAEGATIYMSTLPDDPLPGQNYTYQLGSDSDPTDTNTFSIMACLENPSDDKCDKVNGNIVSCGTSGCEFTVKP